MQLISETALRIFPKLVMKLEDNKGKRIAGPFLKKILILPKFSQMCRKMAILAQNSSFWDFAKNVSNKYSKIALKRRGGGELNQEVAQIQLYPRSKLVVTYCI